MPRLSIPRALTAGLAALVLLVTQSACAGALRDRLNERRTAATEAALPEGARLLRDVAYGPDRLQRFDVYLPAQPRGAPVIFMVHGGGWRQGDKREQNVVKHKALRWVPRGFIFVSVNYRMLPDADPVEQARDVGRALAVAQEKAASVGGDKHKFVLMGHSAGAHLVALLSASPETATRPDITPWLGVVALDSAALDVPLLMSDRHFSLHDDAFGKDPAFWRAASPYHLLTARTPPYLLVCSTQREDACPQARRFAGRAHSFGTRAEVLTQDLSHEEANDLLGTPGPYTEAVEAFLASLDPALARALGQGGKP